MDAMAWVCSDARELQPHRLMRLESTTRCNSCPLLCCCCFPERLAKTRFFLVHLLLRQLLSPAKDKRVSHLLLSNCSREDLL